jgi:hypothetical protein
MHFFSPVSTASLCTSISHSPLSPPVLCHASERMPTASAPASRSLLSRWPLSRVVGAVLSGLTWYLFYVQPGVDRARLVRGMFELWPGQPWFGVSAVMFAVVVVLPAVVLMFYWALYHYEWPFFEQYVPLCLHSLHTLQPYHRTYIHTYIHTHTYMHTHIRTSSHLLVVRSSLIHRFRVEGWSRVGWNDPDPERRAAYAQLNAGALRGFWRAEMNLWVMLTAVSILAQVAGFLTPQQIEFLVKITPDWKTTTW